MSAAMAELPRRQTLDPTLTLDPRPKTCVSDDGGAAQMLESPLLVPLQCRCMCVRESARGGGGERRQCVCARERERESIQDSAWDAGMRLKGGF